LPCKGKEGNLKHKAKNWAGGSAEEKTKIGILVEEFP